MYEIAEQCTVVYGKLLKPAPCHSQRTIVDSIARVYARRGRADQLIVPVCASACVCVSACVCCGRVFRR